MTEQAEQQLRRLFREEDAGHIATEWLAAAAVREVHNRRHFRLGWAATVLLIALSAGATALVQAPQRGAAPQARPTPQHVASGALRAVDGCPARTTTESVQQMAFAFDGTLTRPAARGAGSLALFDVHEWFRGGTAATAAVGLSPAGTATSYDVGSRLLVAGTSRVDGAATACVTAPYDARTAAAWRVAVRPAN